MKANINNETADCVCSGAGWRAEVTCPRHVTVLVNHQGRVWWGWCLESWHRCWVRRLQREMSTQLSSPPCMCVRESVWGKELCLGLAQQWESQTPISCARLLLLVAGWRKDLMLLLKYGKIIKTLRIFILLFSNRIKIDYFPEDLAV